MYSAAGFFILVITECNIQSLVIFRGSVCQVRQTKCQDKAKTVNS